MNYLAVDVCKELQKIGCCPEPIRWWTHWPDGEGWGITMTPCSDSVPIPHPSDVLEELILRHAREDSCWVMETYGSGPTLSIRITDVPNDIDGDYVQLVSTLESPWFEAMREAIQAVLELSKIAEE